MAIVTREEYKGIVFCPTVSTGCFVARRNGKIFLTGNSGFPKSMNISKAINKKLGEDAPEAKEFDGYYSFNPKPAVELVLVAQKPLSEKTYVDQTLANGKGGVWSNACRIPFQSEKDKESSRFGTQADMRSGACGVKRPYNGEIMATNVLSSETGRFPANILVCDDVLNDGTMRKGGGSIVSPPSGRYSGLTYNGGKESEGGDRNPFSGYDDEGSTSRYFDLDAWWEERIKSIDPKVLETFPFLLVPKASVSEKNAGLEDVEAQYMDQSRKVGSPGGTNPRNRGAQNPRKNFHPTVKPVKLFTYLVTLGSRKGDIIVDPFGGSGTTGIAAELLERNYILFEMEQDFHELACKRIEFQQAITKKENATPLSDIFKRKL
ncbi:site-specific DNA-methyltransferase [Candidatus Dependentiae bacterium]|nr:site-specific DNA-methyltransferase [Candidatus Dependentiae bacterium]